MERQQMIEAVLVSVKRRLIGRVIGRHRTPFINRLADRSEQDRARFISTGFR